MLIGIYLAMALNWIWIGFFFIGIAYAVLVSIQTGDYSLLNSLVEGVFSNSKLSFEICIGLAGIMTFWLGLMKVGEQSGLITRLSKLTAPFFRVLFPSLPKESKAFGNLVMSFSANLLGLDNAATPLGLATMKELQEENTAKDTASDSMLMFAAINTAGLTILPVSIIAYRAQAGAFNPADILLPSIIGTFISALSAIFIVAAIQKINLFKLPFLLFIGIFLSLIAIGFFVLQNLNSTDFTKVTQLMASILILGFILVFLVFAIRAKINVYDAFIEGAKEGFTTVITILPYILATIVAIGVFRSSGALDFILSGISYGVKLVGLDSSFIPALPVGLLKPFSGSGARGLMLETMTTYGADSFPAKVACTLQGSTETTFYMLAVYFGAVKIRKTKYIAVVGLMVDFIGVIAGVLLSYFFFLR